MDFYWPLLAVPAAEGVARVGTGLSGALRQVSRRLRWVGGRTLAVVLFVPLLFYAGAIQAALAFQGLAIIEAERLAPRDFVLDERNPAWLMRAPGMPALVAISHDLRLQSSRHMVAMRFYSHHAGTARRIDGWRPYEFTASRFIPDDAVVPLDAMGVGPYYLPDVEFVDIFGLIDATVARSPVSRANSERVIAHDRTPPPGYLQRRGVNIHIDPAVATEAHALASANYALEVGPDIWMPFDAVDHQWANERFAGLDLRARNRFSQSDPAGNRFTQGGVRYVGEHFLGRFDGTDLDGWHREVKAVTNHELAPFFDRIYPVRGHVGPGFLTTYYPGKWERTGRATSPTFTARDDQYLMFLIAGEPHDRVGLRLLADGEAVAAWQGTNWEAFELVIYPLRQLAGKELQLEIFNHEVGDRPRLMLDHVMLVRVEPSARQ